jgi:two-component system response regulator GlrR
MLKSAYSASLKVPMIKRRSLLLVDDESSILQTLRMVFEEQDYQVVTAQSCAEALKILSEGRAFDAVVTDLNMEKEDIGLEVARAALKIKPKPAVVICTGFASVANSRAALDLGVDYMAHKPVELEGLIAALNRLLSRRNRTGRGQ